jgi:hypothetical protein
MAALAPGPRWPSVQVQLPVGGWRVGFHVQPDGQPLIEVTDPAGSLASLITSSHEPILSIADGWAGHTFGLTGLRQWWALAIGHIPAPDGWPAVSFTRHTRHTSRGHTTTRLETADGLWVIHDQLWIAATTGHYTHVRLTMQSATHVRRLNVVTPHHLH